MNGINIDANNIIKPAFDFFGKFVDLIPNKNKQAEFMAEAQRLQFEAEKQLNELEIAMQHEISERAKSDMMSDSWLSKNIRPLALICTSGLYITAMVLSYFGYNASESMVDVLKYLLYMVFGFYFGGRTMEKSVSMVAGALSKKK